MFLRTSTSQRTFRSLHFTFFGLLWSGSSSFLFLFCGFGLSSSSWIAHASLYISYHFWKKNVCFFILHPKVSNAARWTIHKAAMVNNSDVFPFSYIFPLETENLTGSCRGDLFQQKPIPHLHQIKS